MKINKKNIFLYIILICFFCVGVVICFSNSKNILPNSASIITFRNGSTGQKTELTDKQEVSYFINEMHRVDIKISGISLWRSGYQYKIFVDNKEKAVITIRDKHTYSSGMFDYETEENLIELIEKYIQ